MLSHCERCSEVVLTMTQKKSATIWMIEIAKDSGSKYWIAAKAIQRFPSIFTQQNSRSKCEEASHCWWTRSNFLLSIKFSSDSKLSVNSLLQEGHARRHYYVKALKGCVGKRNIWKNVVREFLWEKSIQLRSLGVKWISISYDKPWISLLETTQLHAIKLKSKPKLIQACFVSFPNVGYSTFVL